VTFVYKPPGKDFVFTSPQNLTSKQTKLVLGDFNSHSITWGYESTDKNGDLVEQWVEQSNLSLLHDEEKKKMCQKNI